MYDDDDHKEEEIPQEIPILNEEQFLPEELKQCNAKILINDQIFDAFRKRRRMVQYHRIPPLKHGGAEFNGFQESILKFMEYCKRDNEKNQEEKIRMIEDQKLSPLQIASCVNSKIFMNNKIKYEKTLEFFTHKMDKSIIHDDIIK